MKHFTVHATRSGRWWSITIDEDPRSQTQARRLDQVEDVARSVLIDTEMLTPNEPAAFTVVTQADNLDVLQRKAVAAKEASKAAREFARNAADQGLPLRDIGAMLGVTHQTSTTTTRLGIAKLRVFAAGGTRRNIRHPHIRAPRADI